MNLSACLRPGVACLLSVGLCFLYAATRSELPAWWRNHGGGVPYVLFWILLWYTLIPQRRLILAICFSCVAFTCALEVFQLYSGPAWLADFRRTRFGAAWLGSGFVWDDMPPYFLGGIVGMVLGPLLLPNRDASVTNRDLD